MAKENRNTFRLNLNEQERQQLDKLTEDLSEEIGIDVNRTWVIRELVKLASLMFDDYNRAEAILLKRMYVAVLRSGVASS